MVATGIEVVEVNVAVVKDVAGGALGAAVSGAGTEPGTGVVAAGAAPLVEAGMSSLGV